MIVKITNDNGNLSYPILGELYFATPYKYDIDKVTLHYLVNENFEKSQFQYSKEEPLCNEYRENLEVIAI